jgi:hypothetical protein
MEQTNKEASLNHIRDILHDVRDTCKRFDLSADRPLSENDLELIRELIRHTPNIILLLTKTDLLLPEQQQEVLHALNANRDFEFRRILRHKTQFLVRSCLSYLDVAMPESIKERVVGYILERKCRDGGFCFYRLEEPNGADTYFSLAVLELLNISFRDPGTINYLKDVQHGDGGYESIPSAFYALKGLVLFSENPRHDPAGYIMRNLKSLKISTDQLPTGNTSVFKPIMLLIDLCRTLDYGINGALKDRIARLILRFQNADKGFGALQSTLIDTVIALKILKWLNCPIHELQAESFVKECEIPFCGFTNIPGTSLSFMEYVHAGIYISFLLSEKPRYLRQCEDFIRSCQKNNGGFSRSVQGSIATLEDTYYAIHGLTLLFMWESRYGML